MTRSMSLTDGLILILGIGRDDGGCRSSMTEHLSTIMKNQSEHVEMYDVCDEGNEEDHDDRSVATRVARRCLEESRRSRKRRPRVLGIVACDGTGTDAMIAANKIDPEIRCALCHDRYTAKMSRVEMDANVLAIGTSAIGSSVALGAMDAFVETLFSGERESRRRISKIEQCGVAGRL